MARFARPMLRLLLLTALLFGSTATTNAKLRPAAMRLPEELSSVERWEVEGRQGWKLLERLSFGDFRIHGVERTLTKGGDLQILSYQGSKRRQSFGFTLSEHGEPAWSGAAATNLRRRAVDVGFQVELRNKSGLVARLNPVDEPTTVWTLDLTERFERPLSGTLHQGRHNVVVKGTNALARSPLSFDDTTGYVFQILGRAVAAVEVLNRGAVWIAPDLEPELRGPIVAAIGALLLFEELRPTLPE